MEPGEYLLSVEPFESELLAQFPMPEPQGNASPAPVKVKVEAGAAPTPVTLPVVPVAPLRVVVEADAATRAAQTVWSWAQGLQFTVTDERGANVYAGGPSSLTTSGAELMLRLADGRYIVGVRRRGEVLGERTLSTGEDWRLAAR